ncbi:MAG TPA: Bcr/CflA family efflux MFS transporter [Candidatus Berkiella sp.]|nr:Bcr/CflA family efflux MFS transporter [Candidatus Berkiella sp.]
MKRTPSPLIATIILMIPFVLPLGLALDMYLPSIPSMTQALQASSTMIQLTMSLFLYTFGFGQLLAGPMADSFGRRTVILLSSALFVLGSLVCALTSTIEILIFGRILQALGACGTQVVAMAMVRDRYESINATIIFTSLKAAMALAPIAAPILGAYLQVHYGWQTTFIALLTYGIALWLLGYFKLEETLIKKITFSFRDRIQKPYTTFIKHSGFMYFAICAMTAQAAMFGYFSLSPRFFMMEHNLSVSTFALLFSCNAAFFLTTGSMIGKLIYRFGFRQSTLIGAIMLCISALMMLIGHHYFNHFFILFIPNLLASASAAMLLGASASGALMPFKQNAGAASALFGCIEFIGGGLLGGIAIWSEKISVIPLGSLLLTLGLGLIVLNILFIKRISTTKSHTLS